MRADTIVAYTYRADIYCRTCIVGQCSTLAYLEAPEPEAWLDSQAELLGVDRQDEHTFDSGAFPKVVFAGQVEGPEACDNCGNDVLDN